MPGTQLWLESVDEITWDLPPDRPFTYAEMTAAGLSRGRIRNLLRAGVVRRLLQGVYAGANLPDSVELRAAAIKLVAPDDCVVVDRHAGWLLGAEMALAPGEHIALRPLSVFRPSGSGRLRNGITRSGERWLRESDVIEVAGLQVTTPVRTAWDLGRVRWADEAIAGMDSIAGLDGFDRAEFIDGIEQFRGHSWIRTLRSVAPVVDGRAESPPESILRLRSIEAGLQMVPQVEIWDEFGCFIARMDLADEIRLGAIEYDGVEWHSGPDQKLHDNARRDEARDRGWLVEAFSKENLFGRHRDIDTRLRIFRLQLEAHSGRKHPW